MQSAHTYNSAAVYSYSRHGCSVVRNHPEEQGGDLTVLNAYARLGIRPNVTARSIPIE